MVRVVGLGGEVVRSYKGQMRCPRSVAVTRNDDILVADERNNRILSLDGSLSSVQELALPVDGGMYHPWALCLDESPGRLYVGEGMPVSRVLVFDVT